MALGHNMLGGLVSGLAPVPGGAVQYWSFCKEITARGLTFYKMRNNITPLCNLWQVFHALYAGHQARDTGGRTGTGG